MYKIIKWQITRRRYRCNLINSYTYLKVFFNTELNAIYVSLLQTILVFFTICNEQCSSDSMKIQKDK